jgi:hypothetical protein
VFVSGDRVAAGSGTGPERIFFLHVRLPACHAAVYLGKHLFAAATYYYSRGKKWRVALGLGAVKKNFFFFFSACGVAVLGGYDMEEKAARAYDLAALKYWGPSTHINFPVKKKEKLPLFTLSFLFFFTVTRPR